MGKKRKSQQHSITKKAAINQEHTVHFNDQRPHTKQVSQLQSMADAHAEAQSQPVQKKENKTGLPDQLKTGVENLSGISMDDVRVHYNSSKPAQLQAHAYAQGNQIHIAPGQEKHLAHEAWHVVQQKQGRVAPTKQLKGKVAINDDQELEREADLMGAKALKSHNAEKSLKPRAASGGVSQLKTIQLVKAYRVQYFYNKKIGTHTPIVAPIDISFEFSDHSEYFLDERSEGQQRGLEVVSWDMDDDWYEAMLYYAQVKKGKMSSKVNAIHERFKKAHLPIPSRSDGKDCPKYIRDRALHFQAAWQTELTKGMKGNIQLRDIQAEKLAAKKEDIKEKFGEGASYDEMIKISHPTDGEMECTTRDFEEIWKGEGWSKVE